MGSKVGLILSLIFVSIFVAFGTDLMLLQYEFSSLDSVAVNIGYIISKNGGLTDSLSQNLEESYSLYSLTCTSNCSNTVGELLTFEIVRKYKPLIISDKPMYIKVKRATMIGYYD